MRRRNTPDWKQEPSIASVRAGRGLLGGLLRCGRCGRRIHVRYWGKKGTSAYYLCRGEYGAGARAYGR